MRPYVLTFLALLGLSLLTLALSFAGLGAWEIPVAIAIAFVKASLVAGFFMHLVEESVGNRLALGAAVAFILLLASLTMLDVVTRADPPADPPPEPALVSSPNQPVDGR
jgi:cytochrome c oxidase subunit 4